MSFSDVVDQLHDDHRLPYSSSSERSHLTTFGKRADQVDDLDSGLERTCRCVLLDQRRRLAMDRVAFFKLYRATLVYRLTNHVANSSQYTFPHRNRDRIPGVRQFHTTLQPFGCRHGNRSDPTISQVLLNFENQTMIRVAHFGRDFQCVVNPRNLLSLAEINVHDGTDYSHNCSFAHTEIILRRVAH